MRGLFFCFSAAEVAVIAAAGGAVVPITVGVVFAAAVVGFVAVVVYPVFFIIFTRGVQGDGE